MQTQRSSPRLCIHISTFAAQRAGSAAARTLRPAFRRPPTRSNEKASDFRRKRRIRCIIRTRQGAELRQRRARAIVRKLRGGAASRRIMTAVPGRPPAFLRFGKRAAARSRPSDRVRIRSSLRSACRFVRACGQAMVSVKPQRRSRPSTQAAAGSPLSLARFHAWMRASVGSTLTLGLFLICAREEGPRKGRSVSKSTARTYTCARTPSKHAYTYFVHKNPQHTREGIESTLYALARAHELF